MRKLFPIVSNVNIAANTTIAGVEYVNIGPKFQLPKASFVVNTPTRIATGAGTASKSVITFAGTYAINDQIRVTLTIKDSAQTIIKNFVHTVTNVSVTNIAVAFKGLIEASILEGIPGIASAANVAGVLTITSSSVVSNNFSVTAYTASASGTVAPVFTPVTQAEGIPAVLKSAGIAAADITLATYDTVLLTYKQDAAIPFIDSEGKIVKEVKAFVPVGQGAGLIAKF